MHMGTGFANGQTHTGTGSALVGLIILMYHKIHDCKEEDIGVSDYNRLRIQHIIKKQLVTELWGRCMLA